MRKILFFLCLVLIGSASATIYLDNNVNTTENNRYYNNITDTNYALNISDSLKTVSITEQIYVYPQIVTYKFSNSKNTIEIIKNVTQVEGFFYDDIYITYTVYINNVKINTCDATQTKSPFGNFACEGGWVNYVKKTYLYAARSIWDDPDDWTTDFVFSSNDVTVTTHGTTSLNIHNNNSVLWNNITIPPQQTSKIEFIDLNIKYLDNGISSIEFGLISQYQKLNPILIFVFIILKGILKIFSVLYIISDYEFLQYQIVILDPLVVLSSIIDAIIGTARFILGMGLILTLSLIILISFIYAYITTPDIFAAITKFAELTTKIITTLIITPILWLYEGILKLISIIRGA